MRLYSWNVNGIRATIKKGALVEWIQEEQPDVICLQETKATEDQIPEKLKELKAYHQYYVAAEVKKGYSGVALLTRTAPEKVMSGLGIPRFDREGRTIVVDYGDFVLYNIYFPNGKKNEERLRFKMDFYDAFLEHAEQYRNAGKEVVVCGDVNTAHKPIDLARPKENEDVSGFLPEERAWIDKFLSKGYVDTLRMFTQEEGMYTWWSLRTRARERNVGWRLDYFIVSEGLKDRVRNGFIRQDIHGSDHCPVGMDLAVEPDASG